jgi:hypothetical protein
MLKEALEYIVGLKEPHFHKDAGRTFADRKLEPVNGPTLSTLPITTLGGLCDLAAVAFESIDGAQVVVHVEDHASVAIIEKKSDEWARRTVFVRATAPEVGGFRFGQWYEHAEFIIGLQSNFTATEDRDYLLHLASNLTSERVRVSEDDGISQSTALRAGVVLKADAMTAVKSRVTLAPFRTFREVDQPASEFVLRLRDADEKSPPRLALFEADGGKWKLDAMTTIGTFLRVKLDNNAIPVII